MRITLHDTILADAGEARPDSRPSPGDDVRAPWVRTMHERLRAADADGGSFAAGFRVASWVLQIHAVRHGTAVAAVWSVAADGEPSAQVVAASVLLAGEDAADDEAALRFLRDNHAARLPVPEADYAAIARQPRPCLATLYLDADWYNNGSIELLATALSLATLFGPEGRLNVASPRETQPRPEPAPRPAPPQGPPALSPERMGLIMEMVKKKANLAFEGVSGIHFRVFAPRAFAERRGGGRDLYARLKDTAWWVRWDDDRLDRLTFAEFLAFVDQVLEIEKAFYAAVAGEAPKPPAKANSSTWVRNDPAGPRPAPLRVRHRFDSNKLVEDDTIDRLLDAVTIEPTLPDHTRGASAAGNLFRSE